MTPKRSALITGSGHRIGRALAIRLASEGYALHLHANSSYSAAQDLAEDLHARFSVACYPHRANLSQDRAIAKLIVELRDGADPPDLIINNASVFSSDDDINAYGVDYDTLELNLKVNAVAPVLLSNALSSACNGHIINITDSGLNRLPAPRFYYGLSKDLLSSATKWMAVALAPRIRVNAIAPGLVLPPKSATADYLPGLMREAPLRRGGNVADVAEGVLYLESLDAVTGQTLYIDGGDHL